MKTQYLLPGKAALLLTGSSPLLLEYRSEFAAQD